MSNRQTPITTFMLYVTALATK